MGKVRSNEGEGGVLSHQAAIIEHAAFQRFKSFSAITNTPVHSVEF